VPAIENETYIEWTHTYVPWFPIEDVSVWIQGWFSKNGETVTQGIFTTGAGIAAGVFGAIIVTILVIYFTASLGSIKRGIYQLIPATKRPRFVDLAEQISDSVGRYVIGQVSLALCNGIISFLLLVVVLPLFGIEIKYGVLLAFIAFLGSLIPLVGTLSATVIIVLSVFLFNDFNVLATIIVGAWYLIYMQVEAYVLNPRIMARAVKVPGVVVVIAALVGGTLLGILGALIAIPVAAAVQLIIREVIVPRQNEL
jgi:predicted PurR-regulated permease PerM